MTSTEKWYDALSVRVEGTVLPGGNQALVVTPGSAEPVSPGPGVLWLHWLGHVRNDCSQFLPEAVALAGRGVVSVLPQGTFPWSRRPSASPEDADQVAEELERARMALDHLRSLPAVDPDRTAIVGHDYGAMYAMALRDVAARVVVAATPDSSWPHWFLKYWTNPNDRADGCREALERFDPLVAAAALGDRLVLQWADDDSYVPGHAPPMYAHAAPASRAVHYPYDHQLGDAAVADRLEVLRDALDLAPDDGDRVAAAADRQVGRQVDRRVATVAAVITLLEAREDLRGVNDLADHLDFGTRWGT